MLALRVGVALSLEEGKRADEFWACLRRFDYFVNKAVLGRDVRIRKLFFELHDLCAPRRFFVLSVLSSRR